MRAIVGSGRSVYERTLQQQRELWQSTVAEDARQMAREGNPLEIGRVQLLCG